MDDASRAAGSALAVWLKKKNADIRSLENNALVALNERGDAVRHKKLLHEKAVLTANLQKAAEPLLADLPEDYREIFIDRLTAFTKHAENALNIGSVFYMYALLYPDNHKDGDPNHLESLIALLEKHLYQRS